MTKKQAKSAHPAPAYDTAQAAEAQRIAETQHDSRWPLAFVPSTFLVDISLGNLDLPVEGFKSLDALESAVQTSIGLSTLAELEQVRRHMSAQTGEPVPMELALSDLASAYLAHHGTNT